MFLNENLFREVAEARSSILVVTKYLSKLETEKILPILQLQKPFFGVGENRVEILREKNLPRNLVHFIGRIQSRKIPEIVKYSSVLQSLESLKHAEILDREVEKQKFSKFGIFIQIALSGETQKGGIPVEALPEFLNQLQKFKNLEILGISGMGFGNLETPEDYERKNKEFELLVNLRNKYLPDKKISAGTSRDYKIALEWGIDIVRIGTKCFN